MNESQLIKACEKINSRINIHHGGFQEVQPVYTNYFRLHKLESHWEFSELDFESRPGAKEINRKCFTHENQAISYFFIKLLKKKYFERIYSPNAAIYQIKDINQLKYYFSSLGIPHNYYSFEKMAPLTIYGEVDLHHMTVHFIDKYNHVRLKTHPLPMETAIFAMYSFTRSLHMIKQVENELLADHILSSEFSDDEILLFITNE